jgi:hypothetical protein
MIRTEIIRAYPRIWVDQFFSEIVFGWMCRDIEREIELQGRTGDAGNVLCALALMTYTEFMGRQLPQSTRPCSKDEQHFNAFFRKLGSNYEKLMDDGVKVYDIFRCGLVHEYSVKKDCTIEMLNTPNKPFEVPGALNASGGRELSEFIRRPVACGIGIATNRSYYFVVEKYLEDFKKACENLRNELNCSGTTRVINCRITSGSS